MKIENNKNNSIYSIVFLLLICVQIHVDAAGFFNLSQGDLDYALFGYTKPSVHSGLESYSTTASQITGLESSFSSRFSSYFKEQSQPKLIPPQSAWPTFWDEPAQEIAQPQEPQNLLEYLSEQAQAWADWLEGRSTIQEPIFAEERPKTLTEWMQYRPLQTPIHERRNNPALREVRQEPESLSLRNYIQGLSQPKLSAAKDLTRSIDRSEAPEQSAWRTLLLGQQEVTQTDYPQPLQARWSWASSQQFYNQAIPQQGKIYSHIWNTANTFIAPTAETRTLLPANIYTTLTAASAYQQPPYYQAATRISTVTLPPTSGLYDFLSSFNSNSSFNSKFDNGKAYSPKGESNDIPTLVVV